MFASSADPLFLKMGVTLAYFKMDWKVPMVIDKLYNLDSIVENSVPVAFNILLGILLGPLLLVSLSFQIILLISFSLIDVKNIDCGLLLCKNF